MLYWCKIVIFELILWNAILSISCKIAPRWMPQNPFDFKSTSVQVMAAASHYPSQCWPDRHMALLLSQLLNTLRQRRNEQHFADDIFKRIFFNENAWISIKISLKFVPKGPINNIPALVQIMAWRRSGDKPLSEPMMVSLPTHICVIRPQWIKNKARMNAFLTHFKQNLMNTSATFNTFGVNVFKGSKC